MNTISVAAANILIETLMDRLRKAEKGVEDENEETFLLYQFLTDRRTNILPEWINFVYEQRPDIAKRIVAAYHDETIDLSTLACSAADFKPWEE